MPIFTGTILTWSPSTTKTTSACLGTSFDFLSLASSELPGELVVATEFVAGALVAPAMEFVLGGSFVAPITGIGSRAVTLAMGTERTLVRRRVSISALTD